MNEVIIDDGVAELKFFEHPICVTQSDNFSRLLVRVIIIDLCNQIQKRHAPVNLLLYADDFALYATNRYHIQRALATFKCYVTNLRLDINLN